MCFQEQMSVLQMRTLALVSSQKTSFDHSQSCTWHYFIWHIMYIISDRRKSFPIIWIQHVWVRMTSFPSHGPGVEERRTDDECADVNNTTWLEYRQQRDKLQVQYLLLTRRNEDCAHVFTQESLTATQRPSYFDMSRPTKVIIHGYRWGDPQRLWKPLTVAKAWPAIATVNKGERAHILTSNTGHNGAHCLHKLKSSFPAYTSTAFTSSLQGGFQKLSFHWPKTVFVCG